jgi:hypothetical protein
VLKFLNKSATKFSFVAEYSSILRINANRRRITGDEKNMSINALTGFLTTGISCQIDHIVENGCICV